MFAKLALGKKIGVGFVSLILIAVFLGGLAVWNMKKVTKNAEMLEGEYVPEVIVANNVERSSLNTMYAIRGYSFTEESQYLEEGLANLKKVEEFLAEAEDLAEKSPHLVKLKAEVNEVQKNVTTYKNLVHETEQAFEAINSNRKDLDENARIYMETCAAFLNGQNEKMKKEANTGATAKKIIERLQKINIVNDIIDIGNVTRIAAWRSQAQRDPKIIQDSVPNFEKMDNMFEDLRKITREDADIKAIDDTQAAAHNYKEAMVDLLANWQKVQDIGNQRTNTGNVVLEGAVATSLAGIGNTETIAKDAVSDLGSASMVMLIGLTIAIIVGIVMAIVITRSITKPINNVIDGLTDGSNQVTSASEQVSASSQQLAEGSSEAASSLEEISSSLEEMTSMTKQNAENAKQANNMANETSQAAEKGSNAMAKMEDCYTKN